MTTQDTITPEAHSDIVGGSTAARRLGCPGSYLREKLVPEDPGSIYALEGTALHEMMGEILQNEKSPDDLLPFTYHDDRSGEDFTVDVDLWEDKGAPALDAFDDLLDDIETAQDDTFDMLVENRVEFPGIPGAFGTADIIGRCGGDVYVMDWKFGHGLVPVEENKQLMFYAMGALNSFAKFFGDVDGNTTIHMYIIQPAGDPVARRFSCTYKHMQVFAQRLRDAVGEAQSKDASIEKGPWCKFARCKAVCELHTGAVGDLRDMHERLQTLATPTSEDATAPPSPDQWDELYGDALALADIVEDWCDEIRKQAKAHADAGRPVKGYKLVTGRAGNLTWQADEASITKFFKGRRFKLDDFMPRSLVTPTQANKLLDKAGKKPLPEELAARPPAKTTKLVREDHPGEEVETTTAKMDRLNQQLGRIRGE